MQISYCQIVFSGNQTVPVQASLQAVDLRTIVFMLLAYYLSIVDSQEEVPSADHR